MSGLAELSNQARERSLRAGPDGSAIFKPLAGAVGRRRNRVYIIYKIIYSHPAIAGAAAIAAPIPLAVVGLGKIAVDQHLPALAASSRFELVATVDPHRAWPDTPDFATVDELLASGLPVAAVAICTPPQIRASIATTAIDAGLAVLLEKPPAATVDEALALAARARDRGTVLFAAWHSRFAPQVAAAHAWLAGREVTGGRITWREDVRRWHPGQRWLWQPGGMGVFDPGINALSILTALLPVPARVVAAQLQVPANAHTPIAATLALACAGATIDVELDFLEAGPQVWTLELRTRCGHVLRLDDGGAAMAIDDGAVVRNEAAEYPALYERFADLVAAGGSDADIAPLALVEQALKLGTVIRAEPFIE